MLKNIVYALTGAVLSAALLLGGSLVAGCAEDNEPVNTDRGGKTVIVDEGPVIE